MMDGASPSSTFDCRKAWAATLEELAASDPRIVAVVNDSVGSSNLAGFQKAFPERLVNVGIAEQVMVGVGAGLANGGKVPFVSAASCFLTGRALEQVKADVVYSGYNVKLVGQSSGVAYGELGATHHSIEDFAWLRALQPLTVIVPADPWETEAAVRWAASHDGPVYLRLSRMQVPDLGPDANGARSFEPGKARVMREGADATIIACGTTVHLALEAADSLAGEGHDVRVLSMHSLSPLDETAVLAAAATGAIVTAEEALVSGGLGGAVAELCAAHAPVPLERVGFTGFQKTGDVATLFADAGLSGQGIAAATRRALSRKAG
ncbi:transketolase family protein [Poseidonocella sedimentorum]|uniref:Transketolase subunit B n=1 Tax=Poseidonocella sedimentorum TaxID=871652 RepID=A0A1I6DHU1_9RHOB|nr:transketolase C-terminal domain-containing protein [Poseidonocella sedimentorum]SFR05004.1 transketolase subunit B [Poseidonocella sedimentorum]